MEGARILRDQLYSIEVNNARSDAVLQPNREIKEEALTALSDSNSTKVAKLSWLSSRHAQKAYGSMVLFFTKRAEADKSLREGFFDVGGESAHVRIFKSDSLDRELASFKDEAHEFQELADFNGSAHQDSAHEDSA